MNIVRYYVPIYLKRCLYMTSVNISTFRDNIYGYVNDNILKYGDIININTKNGDIVAMSKEEFDGIMETIYLMQFPGTAKDIKEGLENIDNENYWVNENEVNLDV